MIAGLLQPFQRFFRTEAASGVLLLFAAALAFAAANSPWAAAYHHVWEVPLALGIAGRSLSLSLHGWINDGLMAVFFLLVGLEIKRELLAGELASPRRAALPLAAAIGGMAAPALLYLAANAGTPAARGWGIPMATDIAFALGVLALAGPRVPPGLRVFLAALAIVDDLGAVLVIALFYTAELSVGALGAAGGAFLALVLCNAAGVRRLGIYLAVGLVLWAALLHSGVHATIAGVLLALAVPARPRGEAIVPNEEALSSPLLRLEGWLHGPVAFGIMPLFAFANAGVTLGGGPGELLASPITRGAFLGLVPGKPLGVTLASWLVVRLGLAALPEGVSWRALHGAGWLAGIGFTMSLFIAALAFGQAAPLDQAKIGVLAASLTAGLAGWVLVRRAA
jgi:NhaA family Na+:H+ antiporter